MSFNVEELKSASDDNVPSFLRSAEVGTTTAIRHNTIFEFGKIGKGARIVNLDPTNPLVIRLHNNRATAQSIPISSELSLNEWFAEIHCEPNGTTGTFQLTLELATLNEARKIPLGRPRGRISSRIRAIGV